MSRRHERSTYSAAQTAYILFRSAWASAQQPTPRHARYDTPRSAR